MDMYPMRLGPQTEIKSFLKKFVAEHDLKAAFVMMCCGSVRRASIRYAQDKDGTNKIVDLEENMEINSLVGTISADGTHLHTTLGKQDGSTVSSHVMGNFFVFTTAEIILGNSKNHTFNRVVDARTGFDELLVEVEK